MIDRILLTGASGFLGKAIQTFLREHSSVMTLGRTKGSDVEVDLSKEVPVLTHCPEVVIHAAGKAHIYPRNEAERQAFFQVNVEGTRNLLRALEPGTLRSFILISTVAVYGLESGEHISEDTARRASTPYGLSRIQVEEMVWEWCNQNSIACIVLRLPLVVGHGAPGNLGKMTEAIKRGRYFRLAKGEARKSAVLIEDVAKLIDRLALDPAPTSGFYHLTDGKHPSFYELEEAIRQYYQKPSIPSLPRWLGIAMGHIGDLMPFFPVNSAAIRKIAGTFTFSDEKARKTLGWAPGSVLRLYDAS